MAVRVKGEADGFVAETFLDDFGVHSLSEQQGSMRVPEIMATDAWIACLRGQRLEAMADHRRAVGLAVGAAEYKAVVVIPPNRGQQLAVTLVLRGDIV